MLLDGRRVTTCLAFAIAHDGADVGTGTWTALTQVAADALEVGVDDVDLQIGDSALPVAPGAGGSQGMATWGAAVVRDRPGAA